MSTYQDIEQYLKSTVVNAVSVISSSDFTIVRSPGINYLRFNNGSGAYKTFNAKRLSYLRLEMVDGVRTLTPTTRDNLLASFGYRNLTEKRRLGYLRGLDVAPANQALWYSADDQRQLAGVSPKFFEDLKAWEDSPSNYFDDYIHTDLGWNSPENSEEYQSAIAGDPRLVIPNKLSLFKHGDIAGGHCDNVSMFFMGSDLSTDFYICTTDSNDFIHSTPFINPKYLNPKHQGLYTMDFTARQFDQNLPFPLILPFEEWLNCMNFLNLKHNGGFVVDVGMDG